VERKVTLQYRQVDCAQCFERGEWRGEDTKVTFEPIADFAARADRWVEGRHKLHLRWRDSEGSEEKHSPTTAHHPVDKPPAAASTAVSHTPTDTAGLGKLPGTIL